MSGKRANVEGRFFLHTLSVYYTYIVVAAWHSAGVFWSVGSFFHSLMAFQWTASLFRSVLLLEIL